MSGHPIPEADALLREGVFIAPTAGVCSECGHHHGRHSESCSQEAD